MCGVFPFGGAAGEEEAGKNRSEPRGKDQGAEWGKRDGPGHGLEQAAFYRLQREDGGYGVMMMVMA